MKPIRQLLNLLLVMGPIAVLFLRLMKPSMEIHGRPAWLVGLGWILLCLALRLALMAWDGARKRLPWARLWLPGIFFIEGLGLWVQDGGSAWASTRTVTALVLELALLAFAIHRLRRTPENANELPEEHLAQPLQSVLPPRAARMVALEIVMMASAFRFIFGGWRRADPEGFSYTREAILGALLPALPFLAAGELALLEWLIRRLPFGWKVLIHAAAIYGVIWILGLWASMRARPHTIRDGEARFHHGLLGSLRVSVSNITAIELIPEFSDDWERLAFERRCAKLHTPGPPQRLLRLASPASPQGLMALGKARDLVIISVDAPEALETALKDASSFPLSSL